MKIPAATIELARSVPLSEVAGKRLQLQKAGREFKACCPFHNEKSPSFFINDRKGFGHCFGCGAHVDVIDFLMRVDGIDFAAAVETLTGERRAYASTGDWLRRLEASSAEYQAANGRLWEPDEDERSRLEHARAIWNNARPAAGTLAEAYLRWRGLHVPVPPSIRYVPDMFHSVVRRTFPALVAAVQDSGGRVTAVQRIFLAADGQGKAPIDKKLVKRTKGPLYDGSVRLGKVGRVLGVAEGIETALSARQIFSLPVWAACGTRMHSIMFPELVEHVVIFGDAGEAGQMAAQRAADAYARRGLQVDIEAPREGDWNDVLRAQVAVAA